MQQLKRARTQLKKLQQLIPRLGDSSTPEAVHSLRTTVRRLQAITGNYVRRSKLDKKLFSGLNQLRKRAGSIRDLDVQSDALHSLYIGGAAQQKQLVQRALDRRRKKQVEKLRGDIEKALNNGMLQRLKDFSSVLESASAAKKSKKSEGRPLADARKMLRQLVMEAPAPAEAGLHGYRLRCKRIRYIAEMDATPDGERLVIALKQVQDAIGEWHDWVNLLHSAEQELDGDSSPALLNAIANMSRVRLNRALAAVSSLRFSLEELSTGSPAAQDSRRKPVRAAAQAASRAGLTA